MGVLSNLKPEAVFDYFEQICQIPHGSKNTKQISDFLVEFANKHNLRYRQDEFNNVVIFKDASAGYEAAPVYIIQGHMDMVCAKNENVAKDMAKEGLDLKTDGEFIWADGTSLGGDDGIAVACMMAILADGSLKHPAIEAVFTVDEEIGMGGAFALDCSDLKGKRMLNLDSEEAGVFTLSCAGGAQTDIFIPAKLTAAPTDYLMAKISCSGFLGGHSGADIADGRGSAIKTLGEFLYFASTHNQGMLLASAAGGMFDNVICTNAEAVIIAPADAINPINSMCLRFREKLKEDYSLTDPDAEIKFELMGKPDGRPAFALASTQKILSAWNKLPQGVIEMLDGFVGVPKTSLNVGIVKTDESGIHFNYLVRSSVESEKQMLVDQLKVLAHNARGQMEITGVFPAWPYKEQSSFRDLAVRVYTDMTGNAPGLAATHGGLECGIFSSKIENLDVISLGPDIFDIHSPREKLDIKTTELMYNFVVKLLQESK